MNLKLQIKQTTSNMFERRTSNLVDHVEILQYGEFETKWHQPLMPDQLSKKTIKKIIKIFTLSFLHAYLKPI